MFHITLITVGKLKERYYAAAADEYIRRLGAYCKFELIELPESRLPDDPNGTQIAAGLAREAEQIEAKLPRGAWFCVLTPEGTELSSEGLAERLQAEKLNGRSAAWLPDRSSFGIDARIKRMADFRLSFSKMTFPHHLMRVMALEQLYRAEAIQAAANTTNNRRFSQCSDERRNATAVKHNIRGGEGSPSFRYLFSAEQLGGPRGDDGRHHPAAR